MLHAYSTCHAVGNMTSTCLTFNYDIRSASSRKTIVTLPRHASSPHTQRAGLEEECYVFTTEEGKREKAELGRLFSTVPDFKVKENDSVSSELVGLLRSTNQRVLAAFTRGQESVRQPPACLHNIPPL